MITQQYWLYEWMDRNDVKDLPGAVRALASSSGAISLQQLAAQAERSHESPAPSGYSLLAGSAIDLSGQLDCYHPDCLKKKVDELITRIWHYFDKVVLSDTFAHQVSHHWEAFIKQPNERFLTNIQVLLYLRQLGADHLVDFRSKPRPCEDHWERHAADAGLQSALISAETLAASLAQDATIFQDTTSQDQWYVLQHPDFEHTVWVQPRFRSALPPSDMELRTAVAKAAVIRYMACLTSDVSAAQFHKLPLGCTVNFHRQLLASPGTPDARAVAFDLGLPFLDKVAVADLIRIRQDHQDAFERFRDRLRIAISQMASLQHTDNPTDLAAKIRQDLIEPELRSISARLRRAQSSLTKKGGLAIGLGTLITTVGLIAGVSPATASLTGLGAAAGLAASATAELIDENAEASLSDMYLVWKAIEHIQ